MAIYVGRGNSRLGQANYGFQLGGKKGDYKRGSYAGKKFGGSRGLVENKGSGGLNASLGIGGNREGWIGRRLSGDNWGPAKEDGGGACPI